MFTKHDEWVIVLFHATLGALDTRLEPGHYTFLMKHMLATKLFGIGTFHFFKTDGTCFGKMCTTPPVLHRLCPAFAAVLGQR